VAYTRNTRTSASNLGYNFPTALRRDMASHKYSKSMAEDLRTVGNYSFYWTKEHTPKEKTDPLRFEHDELGAATVNIIQKIHQRKQEAQKQRGEQIMRHSRNSGHRSTQCPIGSTGSNLNVGSAFSIATHWETSLASRSRDLLARTRLQQV
jgi:hypothetical protein